jgi:hypothetical protein
MERGVQSALFCQRRIQDTDDFLVGAQFVEMGSELGQQHVAQFGRGFILASRGHQIKSLTIFFNAGGEIPEPHQFQAEIHHQVGIGGVFLDGQPQ